MNRQFPHGYEKKLKFTSMVSAPQDVTVLLKACAAGDRDAFSSLVPIVYDELKKIARNRLRSERRDHTLTATALVHEAYLELIKLDQVDWQDRAHFFAIAARAMRHILVDYALRRKAKKRGGNQERVHLDEVVAGMEAHLQELVILDDVLRQLEKLDSRQARVVECRVFGGLSLEETAQALGTSPATVSRDWMVARAWLNQQLSR